VAVDVFQFMQDRLRVYLKDQGYAVDEVESVVAQQPKRIDRVPARLEAVHAFSRLPEAEALAAANKRIRNILRKANTTGAEPDIALMTEDAEKSTYTVVTSMAPLVETAVDNLDYTGALKQLAALKVPVDRFFDEVMVMTDEPLIRANRLALLNMLGRMMNSVADISKLSV
jgi:glycyl-tRNA synthetase beta chain